MNFFNKFIQILFINRMTLLNFFFILIILIKEFFNLTSQCVKLNSPFMDDILSIDMSKYYKTVKANKIPYHKWYRWIQKNINELKEENLRSDKEEII